MQSILIHIMWCRMLKGGGFAYDGNFELNIYSVRTFPKLKTDKLLSGLPAENFYCFLYFCCLFSLISLGKPTKSLHLTYCIPYMKELCKAKIKTSLFPVVCAHLIFLTKIIAVTMFIWTFSKIIIKLPFLWY